jgi:Cu2+-exporting ATPase
VQAVPGMGVSGVVAGREWRIGRESYVAALQHDEAGVVVDSDPNDLRPPEVPGTRVALGNGDGIEAWFVLGDRLRDGAAETVAGLRGLGLEVEFLSGDRHSVAAAIAAELGIERVLAEQTPEDKLRHLQQLQEQGARVMMVGDGVNDAPVLAAATVSLAMGSGTQVAHASADMVLLSGHLPDLLAGVGHARRSLRIVRENLSWALIYNGVALPLAAMGFVVPWMAALGMSASSLLVVVNALRLKRIVPPNQSRSL